VTGADDPDVGAHVVGRWGHPPSPEVVSTLNNLVQVYALLADHGRTNELAALFTPDAEWDGGALGYGTATGPAAIAVRVTGHVRESEPMMHMTGPPLLIAATETEVHGVAWSLATRWEQGDARPLIYFYYEDAFRKDIGFGWRFSRRVLRRRLGRATS
jgi:SnoaL-like domain